jgi:hypothetical protein
LNITTTTPIRPRRTWRRHDLAAVLPDLAHRVRSGEFTTLEEVAAAFGVDATTVSRWKDKAVSRGLIDARAWHHSILEARLSREMVA